MSLLLLLLALLFAPAPRQAAPADARAERELVVLVHGLGRTPLSMLPLEWELERAGYEVLNWGYSSTTASVAEIGGALAARVDRVARAEPGRRIHFVGHSLGNIIVRWVFAHRPPESAGRVVMLAPPNRGTRAADRFAPWLGWLLKPLPELTTAPGSTARSLPGLRGVEFGIIAGAEDDKVRPEEAVLEGAADGAVVPAGHTFLMARDDVQGLVLEFLRTGCFEGGCEGFRPSAAAPRGGDFSRPAGPGAAAGRPADRG